LLFETFFVTDVFQCALIVLLFNFYLSVTKWTVALSIGLLYQWYLLS